jgi:LacI family transcriptional regulator
MSSTGSAGQPRTTIRDVAEAAKVHISTVSRALDPNKSSLVSPATRARIVAVAESLNYAPHLIASQLRRGRTHTVGVVIPDLGNPVYAPMTRGITQALDRDGFMPLVADTEDDLRRFVAILHHLASRRVDAIITSAAREDYRDAVLEFVGAGLPFVLAVRDLPGSGVPSVYHDDELGGRLAGEHLIRWGHVRLAQLRGPQDVSPFTARTRGFAAALTAAGLDPLDLGEPARWPTVAEGRRLMKAVIEGSGELPTAIFAQNDLLAIGALEALEAGGLHCPEDVSLIGYNDVFFAEHARTPLTTIRMSAYDIGQLAGQMAIELIEARAGAMSVSAPPTLVARASVGPPRKT